MEDGSLRKKSSFIIQIQDLQGLEITIPYHRAHIEARNSLLIVIPGTPGSLIDSFLKNCDSETMEAPKLGHKVVTKPS